eukprot:NODE_104_length_19294_cov_0.449179.p9 type:complete len:313 gc:universal NODE_104_length_19294_cov_0.449179:15780-16718(+)
MLLILYFPTFQLLMTEEFTRSILEKLLPTAEEHLKPKVRSQVIDCMNDQQPLFDNKMKEGIQNTFENAQNRIKEKLSVFSFIKNISDREFKCFDQDSQNAIYNSIKEFYEASKPEASEKAANSIMNTLRESIEELTTQGNHGERSQKDRSMFSDILDAAGEMSLEGNSFKGKLISLKELSLEKFDNVLELALAQVRNHISSNAEELMNRKLESASREFDFDFDVSIPQEAKGFESGVSSFKTLLKSNASNLLDKMGPVADIVNPKKKINDILIDLKQHVLDKLMKELDNVLLLVKSANRETLAKWFDNKLHL